MEMTVMTIAIETVAEQPVAASVERVPMREIGAHFRKNLDKVYAFFAAHPEYRLAGAHNVFIYRHAGDSHADGRIAVEYGVFVARPFPSRGDIVCTATPAGRIAAATHIGPYDRLGLTHDAVQKWCKAAGHRLAGTDWEIYGDWNDDPARLETRVCYLLAP
jgi:effector-binding domain-containing protein